MSVSRNPTGALIPNQHKELQPRVAEPIIESAKRVRVPREPGPVVDVEGSHPRPLHVGMAKHDPLDVTDIPGSQTRRRAGLVTSREIDPLCPVYTFPGSSKAQKPPEVAPFKRDLSLVDDIPGAKAAPLYDGRPVRLSVRAASPLPLRVRARPHLCPPPPPP